MQGKQIGRAALQDYLTANPSATLAETRIWLMQTHQETVSISAIAKFVRHQLRFHYKESRIIVRKLILTTCVPGIPICQISDYAFIDSSSSLKEDSVATEC